MVLLLKIVIIQSSGEKQCYVVDGDGAYIINHSFEVSLILADKNTIMKADESDDS